MLHECERNPTDNRLIYHGCNHTHWHPHSLTCILHICVCQGLHKLIIQVYNPWSSQKDNVIIFLIIVVCDSKSWQSISITPPPPYPLPHSVPPIKNRIYNIYVSRNTSVCVCIVNYLGMCQTKTKLSLPKKSWSDTMVCTIYWNTRTMLHEASMLSSLCSCVFCNERHTNCVTT